MDRIRVLLISVRADPGGGPKHIDDLLRYLPAGIEPYVACPSEKPYWELYAGWIGTDRLQAIPHRSFSWSALYKLVRFVRTHRIELIHSHGKGAGVYGRLLALLTRRRCVHTYHGIHIGTYGCIQRRAYVAMERILAHATDRFVAVSASEAERLLQLGLCPAAKLVTVVNGVALPEMLPQAGEKIRHPFKVLSSSWFNRQKNSEMLLPILQALQEMGQAGQWRFVVMGDGEGRSCLERKLHEQVPGIDIEFAGLVDDPSAMMRGADCFLSTSRWEGLPYAILEAMAHGLPVVATDVTGNRDLVVHEQTGLLFALDRPEQAAAALLRLAENRPLASSMGGRGRLRVQTEFGLERMVLHLCTLYQKEAFSG